jgi:asparagine synthase (glutamine-hydrolysing)
MCGIFTLLNNVSTYDKKTIIESFKKGESRGPEYSKLLNVNKNENIMFGFHRLAINGLNEKSHQPLIIGEVVLICNGEIYNYKELYEKMNIEPTTSSDCEIIIHLYKQYGIEYTLQVLDGVFSFALYDTSDEEHERPSVVYIARDPYGVRPLYMLNNNTYYEQIIGFASEVKMLMDLSNSSSKITHVEPGTLLSFGIKNNCWVKESEVRYHTFPFNIGLLEERKKILNHDMPRKEITTTIEHKIYSAICLYLNRAVEKRIVGTTERPVACLLSGGLDSSLIAALVTKYYQGHILETFSIGMEGSEDLKYAQMVADHIGSKHTSVIVTEDDFFNAIPEVIAAIESYDTTTVRASVGNYLLGKYIKKHSKAKVIFNGDGSDELTGGYLYMQEVPNDLEFDKECKRLLKDIHAFDVLRSDKCISSHGLEPRTPFLDRAWVNYYLSIPAALRNHAHHRESKEIEKHALRFAFSMFEPDLLPYDVLWRTKEAFSDGVSGTQKSWYEVIRDRLADYAEGDDDEERYHNHNVPKTKEQRYYRDIYDKLYPNTHNLVPYFWMPRYVDATDASARTLDVYKNKTFKYTI